MAGPNPETPFRRIEELAQENEGLREQLRQKQAELEEADAEIKRLRQELKEAQRAGPHQNTKRKKKDKPKRPGRKPGQGTFRRRSAPCSNPSTPPPEPVPVTVVRCPCCGGELKFERVDKVSNTDIPPQPEPEIRRYAVEVFRCQGCGQRTRGTHPDVAPDQYGATAHRLGLRVMAAAHTIHYGFGVPMRKVPSILRELTGVTVTQSALTQDALRRAEDEVGAEYQALRAGVCQQPTVNTDDTGFRINGAGAFVMAFDAPASTVYRIRRRHRNEEVRELIPADYGGVMGTDRGKSYDAEELLGGGTEMTPPHSTQSGRRAGEQTRPCSRIRAQAERPVVAGRGTMEGLSPRGSAELCGASSTAGRRGHPSPAAPHSPRRRQSATAGWHRHPPRPGQSAALPASTGSGADQQPGRTGVEPC